MFGLFKLIAPLLTACCFASFFAVAGEISPETAERLSENPNLLLEYHYYSDALENDSAVPRFRLYGDGSALVNYPVHMTLAGDYLYSLSATQLTEIILLLKDRGIANFNEAIRDTVSSSEYFAQPDSDLVTYKSHSMLTRIVLYPELSATGLLQQEILDPIVIEWADLAEEVKRRAAAPPEMIGLSQLEELIESYITASTNPQ